MSEVNSGSNLDLAMDPSEIAYPWVSRGVAWMDENIPDWYERIDGDTLDIANTSRCVICQITEIPDFVEAIVKAGIYFPDFRLREIPDDEQGGLYFDKRLGLDLPNQDEFSGDIDEWCRSAERLWLAAAAARVAADEAK